MSGGDNRLRQLAIPYRADWFDSTLKNYASDVNATGDIAPIISLASTANGTNYIRFCRPEKGQLIEAKLLFDANVPTGGTSTLRIFSADFQSDGISVATTTVTPERKVSDWKKVSGNTSPSSYTSGSQILLDGLDLLPIIPVRGDSNFNSDGFIIGFELILAGTPSANWYLNNFKLDCSVQLAATQ